MITQVMVKFWEIWQEWLCNIYFEHILELRSIYTLNRDDSLITVGYAINNIGLHESIAQKSEYHLILTSLEERLFLV